MIIDLLGRGAQMPIIQTKMNVHSFLEHLSIVYLVKQKDKVRPIVCLQSSLVLAGPPQSRVCLLVLQVIHDFVELIELLLVRLELLEALLE